MWHVLTVLGSNIIIYYTLISTRSLGMHAHSSRPERLKGLQVYRGRSPRIGLILSSRWQANLEKNRGKKIVLVFPKTPRCDLCRNSTSLVSARRLPLRWRGEGYYHYRL